MVDDKSITSDLDKSGYRKVGIHIHFAKSFEDIENKLQSTDIQLIAINMDFDQVDPVLLCKHYASKEEDRLPIIMTSVSSSTALKKNALNAGADLFIEQPVPRDYFVEKIKVLIEHQTRGT